MIGWLVGWFIYTSDPPFGMQESLGHPGAWLEARSNGLSPGPQRFSRPTSQNVPKAGFLRYRSRTTEPQA